MGSFKVRLAAYFALIALLPFAAAFEGFHSLSKRSETKRVDAVLESGIRSALAAYEDELFRAQQSAEDFARDPKFQRALAERDRKRLAQLVGRARNIRVKTSGLTVGRLPAQRATRVVSVRGRHGGLAEVTAAFAIDDKLAARLQRRAGLESGQRIVFVESGRVVAGRAPHGSQLTLRPGDGATVSVGETKYRGLESELLPEPAGTAVAVLAPQRAIDESAASIGKRLTMTMLITLVLLLLIAYVEGRSLVRRLGRLASAANDLARGDLDRRVEVRGRDEFAQLGTAFNEMADQLGTRLNELEEERRRLRDATLRFGEALVATHDVKGLLRVVVETAVESTGALGGAVTNDDEIIVSQGDPTAGTHSLELVLRDGDETFGTLLLRGNGFTKEQAETAEWLVGHAVVAIGNARKHRAVQRQALVDGLTGLANRRLCEAALEKEISRARRFEEPLAVVVADLDDFKAVNDRHGHQTGDKVLREVALALKETLRDIDLAARWGGEEFVVVLPGTDLDGGANVAERVRRALRNHAFQVSSGELVSFTASFGVASTTGQESAAQLLAAADTALYRAKRTGKDRVATTVTYDEPSVRAASIGT